MNDKFIVSEKLCSDIMQSNIEKIINSNQIEINNLTKSIKVLKE